MPTTPSTNLILEIYDRLLAKTGNRHWWPVKYNSGANAGFEISAGAILVQNTAWSNAERALANLHTASIWGYSAVNEAPEADLIEAIRSSGYYNTKTKKLKAFAQVMVEDYEGDDANLFALDLPELRTRLLSIYGIGEETADDIILYAAKKPSFVMDTYTRRLVDRLGWGVDKNNYSDYQRLFESHLEPDVEMWGDLHAQLDGHAARVCRKLNPKCNECVLLDLCSTGQTNTG
ncbi:MAG TPA: endonuclease III domain-containing protein [Dehalococcoidia bacterium]|jgi:endonuclease-3 related protein|nr:endonuclease [Chloroflexota bacterium]MDP6055992.1 endonuclease III domain-containing protein [Dehalococcoidia bacterium]MDP7090339.1 endonuclease III domain-containing protein [Dehalococcoidia bacterium]MDP7262055.1 endonuclease III domain-containing protein [Dehalococcoidia bacterium]HJP28752.1 endonuclease III domain-containing protein [Dehalococcoidia bacterium]|tara:strand:+ start:2569 stop:3267 length:699 start_codon:yes stop_codon:yes gene_type:complete